MDEKFSNSNTSCTYETSDGGFGLLQTATSSRKCTISAERAHRQLGLNADTGVDGHRPYKPEPLSKSRFCSVAGKVDETSNEAPNEGWSPCILLMHFIVFQNN
ncbi:TPA: hypothetical protein ACH3X1_014228 [Trebouxia sp. C0004]